MPKRATLPVQQGQRASPTTGRLLSGKRNMKRIKPIQANHKTTAFAGGLAKAIHNSDKFLPFGQRPAAAGHDDLPVSWRTIALSYSMAIANLFEAPQRGRRSLVDSDSGHLIDLTVGDAQQSN